MLCPGSAWLDQRGAGYINLLAGVIKQPARAPPIPIIARPPAPRTPQGAGVKKEGRPAELGSLRVVSHLNQPLQLVGSADHREEKNI